MKNLIFISALLLIGISALAQNISPNTPVVEKTKKEKKLEQEAILEKQFNQKMAMVNSRKFVLEVEYMIDRSGKKTPVSSAINFILVDSAKAVVQTGMNAGAGANGVGGLTANGKITTWKVEKNEKNKSFNIQINTPTDNGILTIFINQARSGRTSASILGNQWFSQFTYDGKLVELNKSIVYQGRSLFKE